VSNFRQIGGRAPAPVPRCTAPTIASAGTSAGQKAQPNGPGRVVRVRVEEADRLPRPESETAAEDRDGQRWTGEERHDVVGPVTARSVAVSVRGVIARQQPVESGHQVVVRPGSDLDDHDPGRGVRDEYREETIVAARCLRGEGGARLREVE
jgi:hypothetical protein